MDNEVKKPSIYSPEYIPFHRSIQKKHNLTTRDTLIYGFIRFYLTVVKGESFYFSNQSLADIVGYKNSNNAGGCVNKLEKLGFIKCIYKIKADGGKIRFIEWLSNDPICEKTKSDSIELMSPTQLNNRDNNNKINKNNISIQNAKEEKTLPDLIDQFLTPEQIFKISLLKNVWCADVIKKYYAIRDIIEAGEFKAKWGKNLYFILLKWIQMDINRRNIDTMDDVRAELNKWNDPIKTVPGKKLFERFEKARKEKRI